MRRRAANPPGYRDGDRRTPARLDTGKRAAFLGEESHTPLGEAVRRTLPALKVR